MGEHALFTFSMFIFLLVSFLVISLVPFWANPKLLRQEEDTTEKE